MNDTFVPSTEAAGEAPALSAGQRIAAIFTRPQDAWSGLEARAQWWVPFLIVLALSGLAAVGLHNRAVMPMILEAWDDRVASGAMTAEQAAGAEKFMSGPIGMVFTVVQQSLVLATMTFLWAFLLSFAVGFLMGGKLRYRLGLEIAAWSGLVALPGHALVCVLAWFRETFKGVHIGLGAFVPEADPPSKLLTGFTVLLDAIGPFGIWMLVVSILGAAALSGLPRRKVAWTISAVYLAQWIFFAALAALFNPGA